MTRARAKVETLAFSATVDDYIVKWFPKDRKKIIRKLKSKGFSRGDIIGRARQLGLSEQFLKRCTVGNPDVALRACLSCGERFLSVGVQNRLCNRCKNRGW